jgi:cation diffusion facilitator CzcD-associated flavoprotein CzcO
MTELQHRLEDSEKSPQTIDAVIVGAGFSGLYMLHRLRQIGISACIFETADGVGGTWYWNRYPGARCDVESMQYSYSFSDELQQEWQWTQRYASQSEILRYLNYVADKFDLRKDTQFETRVTAAVLDEGTLRWNIQTNRGDQISAKFCIMATGCLSTARLPNIKGLDTFKGHIYHTGQWPHKPVDFNGCRVAVVGTGSSSVQSMPMIAQQATHVYVFQRTPTFCSPAENVPLDAAEVQIYKANYNEHRSRALNTLGGFNIPGTGDKSALSVTPEEREHIFEEQWKIGGFALTSAFIDLMLNKEANDTAAEFVRSKIRAIVKDPVVAEVLLPYDYAIGTKRLCMDTRYYETFNRDNVTLVNLRKENIEEITPVGLKTKDNLYEVDSIVFATGFDAMTGALNSIDIRGRSGYALKEKWTDGPRTYLGIMTVGFPNLFMITGPGSPSVLSNMVVSIEQHVEWLGECLDYLRKHHFDSIEPTIEAEDEWVHHVNMVANATLYPTANSWYVGANITGKARVFMPYIGGVPAYRQKCEKVAANAYEGFQCKKHESKLSIAAAE